MTNYYDLLIVSKITTFFDLLKVSKMTNYYDLFQAVSNKAIQSTLSLKKVKIESKDADSYLLEKSSSK